MLRPVQQEEAQKCTVHESASAKKAAQLRCNNTDRLRAFAFHVAGKSAGVVQGAPLQ